MVNVVTKRCANLSCPNIVIVGIVGKQEEYLFTPCIRSRVGPLG